MLPLQRHGFRCFAAFAPDKTELWWYRPSPGRDYWGGLRGNPQTSCRFLAGPAGSRAQRNRRIVRKPRNPEGGAHQQQDIALPRDAAIKGPVKQKVLHNGRLVWVAPKLMCEADLFSNDETRHVTRSCVHQVLARAYLLIMGPRQWTAFGWHEVSCTCAAMLSDTGIIINNTLSKAEL